MLSSALSNVSCFMLLEDIISYYDENVEKKSYAYFFLAKPVKIWYYIIRIKMQTLYAARRYIQWEKSSKNNI